MKTNDRGFKSWFDRRSPDALETRLGGTRIGAFARELFANSGHFLMLNALSEMALMGWWDYFTYLGHYIILLALLLQTFYLSRPQAHRFWGNLIGAGVYTLADFPLEGWEFFSEPNHLVLWGFSGAIALLQGWRFHWGRWAQRWIVPLESIVRMGMLLALYWVLKLKTENLAFHWDNAIAVVRETHHRFLVEALLLTGLLVGFQTLQVMLQSKQLQETAKILRNLAQWGLGSYAVEAAVLDPRQLKFQRQHRTFVFMDVRGFTHWCEQTDANEVANILNRYYQQVEPAAMQFQPLRVSLTADEVMAIYSTVEQGICGAIAMQKAARQLLAPFGLGAGCAVHCGTAIEGLFGGEDSRTYTAIGDVVNTAKRLESATPADEITVSDAVLEAAGDRLIVEARSPVRAKGKTAAIRAWQLIEYQKKRG